MWSLRSGEEVLNVSQETLEVGLECAGEVFGYRSDPKGSIPAVYEGDFVLEEAVSKCVDGGGRVGIGQRDAR